MKITSFFRTKENNKHGIVTDKFSICFGSFYNTAFIETPTMAPSDCEESQHGCCPDGISEAMGPGGAGCPTSIPGISSELYMTSAHHPHINLLGHVKHEPSIVQIYALFRFVEFSTSF